MDVADLPRIAPGHVPDVPDIPVIVLVVFLLGTASAGVSELLKLWLLRYVPKEGPKPFWYKATVRTAATVLATLMGSAFFAWPWGTTIGACAGALTSIVYERAKDFIKNVHIGSQG